MSDLRLDVHKQREQIEVSADLIKGWQKLQRWCGIDASCFQPYGDELLQCSLRMVLWNERPDLREDAIKTYSYPPEGRADLINIRDGKLTAVLPLNEGWDKSRRGHPTIRVSRNVPILRYAPLRNGKMIAVTVATFRLELAVVRVPPRSMIVPDAYEFGDGHALVGGLPGTNRRH